jgi:hypothetical protein
MCAPYKKGLASSANVERRTSPCLRLLFSFFSHLTPCHVSSIPRGALRISSGASIPLLDARKLMRFSVVAAGFSLRGYLQAKACGYILLALTF